VQVLNAFDKEIDALSARMRPAFLLLDMGNGGRAWNIGNH
jgi:hypothetical protein